MPHFWLCICLWFILWIQHGIENHFFGICFPLSLDLCCPLSLDATFSLFLLILIEVCVCVGGGLSKEPAFATKSTPNIVQWIAD